jgi:hypothetical protein
MEEENRVFPDLNPVTSKIRDGILNWFGLEHGLSPTDAEDCAGEISDELHREGLLNVTYLSEGNGG